MPRTPAKSPPGKPKKKVGKSLRGKSPARDPKVTPLPEPAEAPGREEAPSTFYLSTAAGPPLREVDISAAPKLWRLTASAAEELAGRRGGTTAKWNWSVFERAFVDGIEGKDGKRRWPTVGELAAWSGAASDVVKNRAARSDWYRKRKVHEERLPGLVEEAVTRHVAERIGGHLAAADEAVVRKSARQYLRDIGEPYLDELTKRIRGTSDHGRLNVNATDGERLLRLMLAAEGEATERVAIVGAVQINLNLQRDATVSAIQECAARGLISEDLVPAILETLQIHVSRVRWRFRVDPTDLAALSTEDAVEVSAAE